MALSRTSHQHFVQTFIREVYGSLTGKVTFIAPFYPNRKCFILSGYTENQYKYERCNEFCVRDIRLVEIGDLRIA